jgi:FHA domain
VLNNKGVRVCTVCKSPYKASVRLPGGDSVSLFQSPLPPPYICFMVVTKHQNNEDLFSTKYQLSFSSVVNRSGTGSSRGLVVGRSRQCDMVLDYRTVSTRHAMIKFAGGGFHFSDLMSSNGSYLYLREPLQLPYGETVYLKWGSNVVSLKAKRSIRHRLSNLVGRRAGGLVGRAAGAAGSGAGTAGGAHGTVADFTMLESLCEMGQSPTAEMVSAATTTASIHCLSCATVVTTSACSLKSVTVISYFSCTVSMQRGSGSSSSSSSCNNSIYFLVITAVIVAPVASALCIF